VRNFVCSDLTITEEPGLAWAGGREEDGGPKDDDVYAPEWPLGAQSSSARRRFAGSCKPRKHGPLRALQILIDRTDLVAKTKTRASDCGRFEQMQLLRTPTPTLLLAGLGSEMRPTEVLCGSVGVGRGAPPGCATRTGRMRFLPSLGRASMYDSTGPFELEGRLGPGRAKPKLWLPLRWEKGEGERRLSDQSMRSDQGGAWCTDGHETPAYVPQDSTIEGG
jgi:hypothetical protein